MKRAGRIRDCDSRYLSGRPSFTISSWGETNQLTHEQLTEIGHGSRAPGAHNHSKHSTHYDYSEVTDSVTVGAGGAPSAGKLFNDARHVYTSTSLPLLAHVWPAITSNAYNNHYDHDVGIGHTPAMRITHPGGDRRRSLDQYAAGGSKFRMSTAGIGVSTHEAINTDGLTPSDRKQWEADRHAIAANESKHEKRRWNRSPHVYVPPLPKLEDALSDTRDNIQQTRKKSAKKKLVSAYNKPIRIEKPEKTVLRRGSLMPSPRRIKKAVYVQQQSSPRKPPGRKLTQLAPTFASHAEEEEEDEEDEEDEKDDSNSLPQLQGGADRAPRRSASEANFPAGAEGGESEAED